MTGETVTILRPGASTTTDVYGNPVPGADTRTDVTGCLVAPRLQGDATEAAVKASSSAQPSTSRPGPRSVPRIGSRCVAKSTLIEGDPGWLERPPVRPDGTSEVATRRVEG
jgi:hypothetical protein